VELDGKKAWPFVCPHCDRASAGVVAGKAVWDGYDERNRPVNPPVEWTLVQCHRCAHPTLQAREDFNLGGGFADDDNPATLYPPRPMVSAGIPDAPRKAWEEARRCFDAKAYSGCAAMVRRTVEATCDEQGVKGRSLARMLTQMVEKDLMDATLQQWADALRVLGNRGAHFADEVAREDAEDALHFAEALLNHIYMLRRRFEQFFQRMNQRP
jgi:hypothetical protein